MIDRLLKNDVEHAIFEAIEILSSDSPTDLVVIISYVLSRIGFPPCSEEDIKQYIRNWFRYHKDKGDIHETIIGGRKHYF